MGGNEINQAISQVFLQDKEVNGTVYQIVTTLNPDAVRNMVGHFCNLTLATAQDCLPKIEEAANYCFSTYHNSTIRAAQLLSCGSREIKQGVLECISTQINNFCPVKEPVDAMPFILYSVGVLSAVGICSYFGYRCYKARIRAEARQTMEIMPVSDAAFRRLV